MRESPELSGEPISEAFMKNKKEIVISPTRLVASNTGCVVLTCGWPTDLSFLQIFQDILYFLELLLELRIAGRRFDGLVARRGFGRQRARQVSVCPKITWSIQNMITLS